MGNPDLPKGIPLLLWRMVGVELGIAYLPTPIFPEFPKNRKINILIGLMIVLIVHSTYNLCVPKGGS